MLQLEPQAVDCFAASHCGFGSLSAASLAADQAILEQHLCQSSRQHAQLSVPQSAEHAVDKLPQDAEALRQSEPYLLLLLPALSGHLCVAATVAVGRPGVEKMKFAVAHAAVQGPCVWLLVRHVV